jgi:mannosyltransferase OCH1-like enzyme
MIPKKIHYCWLSGEEFPAAIKKTIDTWKEIMPDYELVLWDGKRFDVNSVACVKDACDSKRWAFAADYIRLHAVYTEGGIYLDSDVIVRKRFDGFLMHGFFSGIDYHYGTYTEGYQRVCKYRKPISKIVPNAVWCGINAAIFGAEKGHPFVKDALDWYLDNQNEIKPSRLDTQQEIFECIAPEIYAAIAESYGFDRTKNKEQNLSENMVIFPTSVFCADAAQLTENAYAVHCTSSGWKAQKRWYHNPIIRKIFGMKPIEKPRYDFYDAFRKFESFNFPKD